MSRRGHGKGHGHNKIRKQERHQERLRNFGYPDGHSEFFSVPHVHSLPTALPREENKDEFLSANP